MNVLSKSLRWLFFSIIATRFQAPLYIMGNISSRSLFFTVDDLESTIVSFFTLYTIELGDYHQLSIHILWRLSNLCVYIFIYSDKLVFVCQSSLFKPDCSDDFSCKGLREKCSISLSIRIDGILRGAEYPLIAPWNRLEKMFIDSGGWAHSSAFLCAIAAVAHTLITSIVCQSLFSFTCPNEIFHCNSNTTVFSGEANVCIVVLTQTL